MIVMSRTVEIQVMNMLQNVSSDIAYQPDVQNAPVVVWFHGGGLTGGSREIPSGLLTDGMVVVGVEYRLSPHVKTMEIVDDAAAVAWVFWIRWNGRRLTPPSILPAICGWITSDR